MCLNTHVHNDVIILTILIFAIVAELLLTIIAPTIFLYHPNLASYPGPFALIVWEEKKGLVSTVWMTSRFGTNFCKMSSRLCMCRVCSAEVAPKHSTALFSPVELKVDLPPGHLSRPLSVPVAEDDGLLPFVCHSCQVKVGSIESKLHKLQKLAKRRYN